MLYSRFSTWPSCLAQQNTPFLLTIVLVVSLLAISASAPGQVLVDSFKDEIPKKDSELLLITADQQNFYEAGFSSSTCGMRYFVRCVNHEGAEQWNTLVEARKMARPIKMHLIDGRLYVTAYYDEYSYSDDEGHATLYRINPANGEVEWQYITPVRSGWPLDLEVFNSELFLLSTRIAGPSANTLRFIERETGLGKESVDLYADRGVGDGLAIDEDGGIYFNHLDRIIKLDAANRQLTDTLWSYVNEDFGGFGFVWDIFVHNNRRLFALTTTGRVYEFNVSTGEIVATIEAAESRYSLKVVEKLVDGDFLYCVWQSLYDHQPLFNVSKVNLATGEALWNKRQEITEINPSAWSLVLTGDSDMLIAAKRWESGVPGCQVLVERVNTVDGTTIAENVIATNQTDLRYNDLRLRRSGEALRLFTNWKEGNPHASLNQVVSWTLSDQGVVTGEAQFLNGNTTFPSAIRQMLKHDDGFIQLRQLGPVVAVAWLDEDFNLIRNTILPQTNMLSEAWAMSVNIRGEVAVACKPQRWKAPEYELAAPGYLLFPLPESYEYHLLSAEGEVLYSHFEESRLPLQLPPEIATDGNDFYTLLDRSPDYLGGVDLVRLNSQGITAFEFGPDLAVGPGAGQFIQTGNELYCVGAKRGLGALFTVTSRDLGMKTSIVWPDFDQVRTTHVFEGSATIVGASFSSDTELPPSAELVHVNLAGQAIAWRQSLEHVSQAQLIGQGQGKVYTLGPKDDQPSICTDLVLTRLDASTGEIDWIKQIVCSAEYTLRPSAMQLNDFEIAVAGAYETRVEGDPLRSFVLRLTLDGEERSLDVFEDAISGPILFKPDGSLLSALEQQFDGNCFRSAALYLLDSPTDVNTNLRATSADLRIFPNPTSDECLIKFNGDSGAGYTIRLFDLLGRQVLLDRERLGNVESGIQLRLGHLERGMYTLELSRGAQRWQGTVLRR